MYCQNSSNGFSHQRNRWSGKCLRRWTIIQRYSTSISVQSHISVPLFCLFYLFCIFVIIFICNYCIFPDLNILASIHTFNVGFSVVQLLISCLSIFMCSFACTLMCWRPPRVFLDCGCVWLTFEIWFCKPVLPCLPLTKSGFSRSMFILAECGG